MRSMTLRETLQPTITQLTEAIDYWSERAITEESMLPNDHVYYHKLVKVMEDLKLFIIEQERYYK